LPGGCLFLRLSPLEAGADTVFFFPEVGSPGDEVYQTVISVRVEIEGFTIAGQKAGGTKQALRFAQGRLAAELKATTLFILVPVNHLEAGKVEHDFGWVVGLEIEGSFTRQQG